VPARGGGEAADITAKTPSVREWNRSGWIQIPVRVDILGERLCERVAGNKS